MSTETYVVPYNIYEKKLHWESRGEVIDGINKLKIAFSYVVERHQNQEMKCITQNKIGQARIDARAIIVVHDSKCM
jgi:hypothetical protein